MRAAACQAFPSVKSVVTGQNPRLDPASWRLLRLTVMRHPVMPLMIRILPLAMLLPLIAEAQESPGFFEQKVRPINPESSRLYRKVARLEKPAMPMQGDPLPQPK